MGFYLADVQGDWRSRVQDQALRLFAASQPAADHEVSMSEPIPRYRLSCRQAREEGIRAAAPAGWRALLFTGGDDPVAAIDLTGKTAPDEVEGEIEDEVLDNFVHALKVAEELGGPARYELRLLESPGLLFSALWLKGEGDEELLVPLVDEGRRLHAFEPVPVAVAEPVLRHKSRKQLKLRGAYQAEQAQG
jgi:hypothetical protein